MRTYICSLPNSIKHYVCGQLISESGFLHQKRTLDEHVLILVNEGTLYISQNNNAYAVSKGQYILLSKNELHFGTSESQGKLSYFWIHFNASLVERTARTIYSQTQDPECTMNPQAENPTPAMNIQKETTSEDICFPEYGFFTSNGRIALLFHQLSDISFQEDCYSKKMCDYAVSMILLELSRENQPEAGAANRDISNTIASAMDWIMKNYHLSFTVSELATRYGYTADYFSNLFAKSTGRTLVSYINSVRIRASKALLANYGVSIKEIAYSCGFPDEKYYMRVFKKSEGMTPSQYRNSCGKSYINQS